MFAIIPTASGDQIINTDHIENVSGTTEVTITFHSGLSVVATISFEGFKANLQALTGVISEYGDIT